MLEENEIDVSEELTEDLPEEQAELEDDSPESEPEQKAEKPESSFIDFDRDLEELPEDKRAKVSMRVNGDYRKIKAYERKEAEYQKKLQEYEQKLAELEKPKEVPPPSPDDWYNDPDVAQQKQQAYVDYVNKQASWEAKNNIRQQELEQAKRAAQQEQIDSFFKKSESAGFKQQEITYAASVVQNYIGEDIANFLVAHEFGPQLLVQLAKNPMEAQEIASLSPYQVGVKLENMAKAFKPTKVTKAPPPDDPIRGSGFEADDQYGDIFKGAKFL